MQINSPGWFDDVQPQPIADLFTLDQLRALGFVDLHPKLIHYPRIFASNFDPCSCRQAPSLLYQAGLAITASPGSNLNANQQLPVKSMS